ncbi:MAG: hypothetical protein H3C43_13380 [Leptonema sp. (in: Bacteria)]|nr:hypothetical protein [Leptonema sp. (in: bacteria)]
MITIMKQEPASNIDYTRLLKSSMYHLKGKLALNDFAYTSSMVCYGLVD